MLNKLQWKPKSTLDNFYCIVVSFLVFRFALWFTLEVFSMVMQFSPFRHELLITNKYLECTRHHAVWSSWMSLLHIRRVLNIMHTEIMIWQLYIVICEFLFCHINNGNTKLTRCNIFYKIKKLTRLRIINMFHTCPSLLLTWFCYLIFLKKRLTYCWRTLQENKWTSLA